MSLDSSHTVDSQRCSFAVFALVAGVIFGGCPATAPTPVHPADGAGSAGPIADDLLCAGPDIDPRCAPDATHQRVELRHHLAACVSALRGPVTFRFDGEDLAALAPGESKTFRLPRGDIEIVILTDPDGPEDVRHLGLYGSGPVKVEVGCAPTVFIDAGLKPLVIRGPSGPDCAPSRVRAGGLDFGVGPRQARTLFLPAGDHLVRIDGQSQTVTVGHEGATVSAGGCGSQTTGAHGSVSSR